MNRRRTLLIVSAGILFISTLAFAETVRDHLKRDPKFRVYAVIFGITLNEDSSIEQFHVAKVIDPRSGNSNDVLTVEIPKAYVAAARKVFAKTKHEPQMQDGKPVPLFIYYLYSPDYPRTVITDLDAPIDKQP